MIWLAHTATHCNTHCNTLQHTATHTHCSTVWLAGTVKGGGQREKAVWWCSVVQCGAVWCSVVQCRAVCCSMLQYVAVYCSALCIPWFDCRVQCFLKRNISLMEENGLCGFVWEKECLDLNHPPYPPPPGMQAEQWWGVTPPQALWETPVVILSLSSSHPHLLIFPFPPSFFFLLVLWVWCGFAGGFGCVSGMIAYGSVLQCVLQ